MFVRARAHVRALMTQNSCAVGMRNANSGITLKWSQICLDMLKTGRINAKMSLIQNNSVDCALRGRPI